MMTITSDKTPIQSVSTSLHGHQLELVDSYKYLGVELNNMLDWDQQWRRVQDKIKSIPFLLKKLKRIGFKPAILKNVYVSLALSQFAYSSPLLTSTSKSAKEMASFHRRVTRIIGINLQEQTDIHEYMETINLRLLNRILAEHDHSLTQKLIEKRSLRSRGQGFIPNLAKKVSYSNSFVQNYLRTINNNGTDKLCTNDNASAIKNKLTCPPLQSTKSLQENYKNPNGKHRTICYICGKDYVGIATHNRLAHRKTNPQRTKNS